LAVRWPVLIFGLSPVDCNSPHPKGTYLTRITDILSATVPTR
jgi:hypothetical protein